jgi:hypothetical protein
VHELVAGAGQPELVLERDVRVEEVPERVQGGERQRAGVEEGNVRAVDLCVCVEARELVRNGWMDVKKEGG